MGSATRRILHADCDQMFVAVARLVDPEGAGRAPRLVVGGRRGERGVVCSASYEVREFGVRSGMPIAQAERLCPDAVFAPVPRKECGIKSREVYQVLQEWSPVVEPASIDEFYLDLSGTEALYRHEPLAETAARIRDDFARGLPDRELPLRIESLDREGQPTGVVLATCSIVRWSPRLA